jgi:DNA-binding MltR family transcriptional regulator
MQSKSRKKASLRDLSRHSLEDWDAYTKEASGESDRACALVVAAVLDHTMVELIRSKLIASSADDDELIFFSDGAPLGTFHGKTIMAFALGIIDASERKDLDVIRRIRNAFAHSATSVTFETDLIALEG